MKTSEKSTEVKAFNVTQECGFHVTETIKV